MGKKLSRKGRVRRLNRKCGRLLREEDEKRETRRKVLERRK